MNLSKHKRWRVLLHRVIKKQAKKEQTHPVCLNMQWISTKMWRMFVHNNYKTISKNEQIKRKQTCFLCLVSMFKF